MLFVFCFFVFLGSHLWHMEFNQSYYCWPMPEPQQHQIGAITAAYARATATPDPSYICDLYHSSRQCWILNPLSEARDRTHNLMVPSRIRFCCAMMGTPRECSNFILLHVALFFSQYHELKRLFFSSIIYSSLLCHRLIEIRAWTYFWTFYPVPLIYMSVFVSVHIVLKMKI